MGKKLVLLGAALTLMVLAGGRGLFGGSSVHADPFGDSMDLDMIACVTGDPGPCNNDANQDVGEVVTTTINTGLSSFNSGRINMSFYDAVQSVITGIAPTGTVPVGDSVGLGSFSIKAAGVPCNSTGGPAGAPYTIFNARTTTGATPPAGYADGSGPLGGLTAGGWISDFDDDNANNLPDFFEVNTGDTDPDTTQDNAYIGDVDALPDGVNQVPTYLPAFETLMGLPVRDVRYFGVANVLGTLYVPVDFVTYFNTPVAGTNTLFAIIQQGSGVGLTPGNPATSGIVTCAPFTSSITTNGKSGTGVAVQTLAATGTYKFVASTANDFDGDGIPGFNDNCDVDPNAAQTDADADNIGLPCDPDDTTAAAADADGDGIANANDGCPLSNILNDSDDDGLSDGCDPDDTVRGRGNGYGFPGYDGKAGAGNFEDHSTIWTDAFAAGANEGTGDASVLFFIDSDDDHMGDAWPDLDAPYGAPDSFDSEDSDGDGFTDGCETGLLLLGTKDAGSDALDKLSTPAAPAVAGDCDNDGTSDATDATPLGAMYDSDGDLCKDAAELARLPKTGNIHNQWDFYSVPSPALSTLTPATASAADYGIGITTDVTALLKYAGKSKGSLEYDQDIDMNGIPDGRQYDRSSVVAYGGSWPSAPDGGIGITTDVTAMLAQAGFTCPHP